MKSIHLLYNPKSGDQTFPYILDNFLDRYQTKGNKVYIFRSHKKGEMYKYLMNINKNFVDVVFVAGGDGSVNEVVNAIFTAGLEHVTLGIIPAGTANDFARFLKIPFDYNPCFEVLENFKTEFIDVGKVNNRYFINVCSGGLFTNVSQNIDIDLKNTLGKLAYYIKGARELPNFKSFPLKIHTNTNVYEEKFYLFLILNSSGAGGFDMLSKNASINDGMLDFVGIRDMAITELPMLFFKLLRGDHITDKNVLFLRDSYFKIESMLANVKFSKSDIDGEEGPNLPLEIYAKNKVLNVITNR